MTDLARPGLDLDAIAADHAGQLFGAWMVAMVHQQALATMMQNLFDKDCNVLTWLSRSGLGGAGRYHP